MTSCDLCSSEKVNNTLTSKCWHTKYSVCNETRAHSVFNESLLGWMKCFKVLLLWMGGIVWLSEPLFLFLYLLHMTVSCDYYISNTRSSLSGFLFWFAHTRLCALWLLNHDPLLEAPTLSQRPSHLCNQVPTSRSVTGNADTLDEWVPIGPNSSLSRWRVLSPLDSLTEFKK